MVTQKEFDDALKSLTDTLANTDDIRSKMYDRAMALINNNIEMMQKSGKIDEVEARIDSYIMILATWNFAYFRYGIHEKYENFRTTLVELEKYVQQLTHENIRNIDLKDNDTRRLISKSYDLLAKDKLIRYTGAAKILHIRLPNLFIMWDQYIGGWGEMPEEMKRVCGVSEGRRKNGKDGDAYVTFLERMKMDFANIRFEGKNGHTFAKAIDEFNFVTITLPIQYKQICKKVETLKTKLNNEPSNRRLKKKLEGLIRKKAKFEASKGANI